MAIRLALIMHGSCLAPGAYANEHVRHGTMLDRCPVGGLVEGCDRVKGIRG